MLIMQRTTISKGINEIMIKIKSGMVISARTSLRIKKPFLNHSIPKNQ